MKTYVWHNLENLTDRWHTEGGLLIITDGEPLTDWLKYRDDRTPDLREDLPEPDLTFNCDATEKAVYVFEDSGCC